jgi:hypothetical protein
MHPFMNLRFASGLLVAMLTAAFGVPVQAQFAPTAPKHTSLLKRPMIFYLAKGEPDACGPGCAEWIAAEGEIDLGAPQRLRQFLAKQGQKRLPIYFHSPGGLAGHSMEIGRLLRERQMTAGVALTVPTDCARRDAAACSALKQSGQPLAAELWSAGACYSGCVYAVIGGKVRQVPPGARLGVHAAKPVQVMADGRVVPYPRKPAPQAAERLDAQLRNHIRAMGISAQLLEIAANTPHEKIRRLTRDEIAKLNIDRREFLESNWMVVESPRKPPSAMKFAVESTGAGGGEFRISALSLTCVPRSADARHGLASASPPKFLARIAYLRGLESERTNGPQQFRLAIGERSFVFARAGAIAKIDGLESGGSFDTRFDVKPLEFFEEVQSGDAIEIVATDPRGTSRVTRLSTAGLARAMIALRSKCADTNWAIAR